MTEFAKILGKPILYRTQSRYSLLPENRCKWCNRLLFKGWVRYIEIKCPRGDCGKINIIENPEEGHKDEN
jgi:phage FluMu protein Com